MTKTLQIQKVEKLKSKVGEVEPQPRNKPYWRSKGPFEKVFFMAEQIWDR